MALIPTTQVNVAPDDYRRKAAYALMVNGADASPVEAWSQGAARVAQALMGQYEMNQLDKKDKQSEADATKAYLNFLQPQGGQASPQSPPAMPPQAPAAPPPELGPAASALAKPARMVSADPSALPPPAVPVMPTDKVWGTDEGEKAGLYEPSKPGMKVAQALAPPADKPAMAPAPDDDGTKARIAALLQSPNKAERQLGKSLAENFLAGSLTPKYDFKTAGDTMYRTNASKGTAEPIRDTGRSTRPMSEEERKNWKVPEGVAAGVDDNGKPVFSQPSNINTVNPVISGINERFDAQMKTAQGAGQAIAGIHEARRALDSGAFTGMAADPKLWAAKVGTMFGLSNEAVANTEKLGSAIGTQVLAHAKTLGANPSNADRIYIEKVMGSKELDEASLRGLLDMQERWARDSVKRANDAGKKLVSTDPEKLGRFAPMLSVDEPQTYDDYVKTNPVQSSKPDTSALKKKYGLD